MKPILSVDLELKALIYLLFQDSSYFFHKPIMRIKNYLKNNIAQGWQTLALVEYFIDICMPTSDRNIVLKVVSDNPISSFRRVCR